MRRKFAVIALPLIAVVYALQPGVLTVSEPNARRIPADPNAPLIVEVPVSETDAPPPFGTIVQQWALSMSGSYAGSGITWRRSQGRFWLMDQGYSGTCRMWSFEPANPVGTLRNENWVFPNFGTTTKDVPWGIAWDDDSSCFWISQILDNNVYGGCYLLRFTAAGTWTGDSWYVGFNNNGGALHLLWLAGMEKWIDRGFFCGAPVHTSPNDTGNKVVKFNPYTRQNLGRVTYGDQTSERGCALVPYDSLYILTCGWNADTYRKRREDGYQLQQVTASYGPADWAMWVPQTIVPTDTAYVFCMNSHSSNYLQKISTGMTWGQLPSVNPRKNVAPSAILAPVATADSGMPVVPRVLVRNKGADLVDSFDVFMRIGATYDQRRSVRRLAGGASDTVTFGTWTPQTRGNVNLTTFTWWPDDEVRNDDTMRSTVLVRVKDVAVDEILAPKDTLDSMQLVYPQCRVRNLGSETQTFNVKFKIGSYENTVTVTSLAPGAARVMVASDPYFALSGTWLHRVEAILAGDVRPENNVMVDTFWVRGTPGSDIAAEAILSPVGRIRPGVRVTPQARVANYGGAREQFWTWFSIWDTTADRLVFHQGMQLSLGGGATTVATFAETTFAVAGKHVARCSVYLAGDQNPTNDVVRDSFTIDPTVYQRNVAVQAISAPSGQVDSGAVVRPTIVVRNTGMVTETFTAYFVGQGYSGVANVIALPSESTRVVEFPNWTVRNPRGSYTVTAWTYMLGDQNPADDTLRAQFSVRVRDVGVQRVLKPVDTIPEGTELFPECLVRNYGTTTESFNVEFRIGTWADTAAVTGLGPGQVDTVTMDKQYTTMAGVWLDVATTLLAGDMVPGNNAKLDTFWVPGSIEHDVGVEEVLEPTGTIDTLTTVVPKARVGNYGLTPETWWTFFRVYDPSTDALVYNESLETTLPAQTSRVLEFTESRFLVPGAHTCRCSTYLETDRNWTNNVATKQFEVGGVVSWEPGWKEMKSVPQLLSGKPVKDGGFLAIDGNGTIYAGKGYKTADFYGYNAITNVWTTLCTIPTLEAGKVKLPAKGACAVSDGAGSMYLVKGNNTLGFWQYHAAGDSWTKLPDVPLGPSNKRVKGGSDVAYVKKEDVGYVYLLKGYKNEVYRFNTRDKVWDEMPPAPHGGRPKYDKGSWLCATPPGGPTPVWPMFCHQAKYYDRASGRHYMFVYNLAKDTWATDTVRGMPISGWHAGKTKNKKSKDGGCAAYQEGDIYALKGGNTQQFFKYTGGDTWVELDTMPSNGSTGRKKYVKYGGDIVSFGYGAFFALKGNKTAEFWRYVIPTTAYGSQPTADSRSGIMAGSGPSAVSRVLITPNPLSSGFATVRFSLPKVGPSTVTVLDIAGRSVLRQSTIGDRQSTMSLDLRKVSAGVYLVRLEADGYSASQRLVVQRH